MFLHFNVVTVATYIKNAILICPVRECAAADN